jgi:hypothetical protein
MRKKVATVQAQPPQYGEVMRPRIGSVKVGDRRTLAGRS